MRRREVDFKAGAQARKSLMRLAAACAIFALAGTLATESKDSALAASRAHSFYIDCSATEGGSGTAASPWSSLQQAVAHGPYSPGDRISLRRGTRCSGSLALTGSGTASHPITLGAYGRGAKPVINGAGTSMGTGAVQLTDVSNWVIEDLRVTNTPKSASPPEHRAGVLVVNQSAGRLSGITIRRLTVSKVSSYPWPLAGSFQHGFGGIAVITNSQMPHAGFNRVNIIGNRVDDVGRSGIITWNHQGQNNTSWDNRVRISGNVVTHAAGDSILMSGATGSRIDHNVARDGVRLPKCPIAVCPDTKGSASAGIWPIFSKDIRIDHNEASGMRLGPGDGEGFDIDASSRDVVFEYNYSHDNQGGGMLLCGSTNATVRFNIFENNRLSAIAFIGSMPAVNTQIYNNTIFASRATRANVVRTFNGPHGTGISFKNNLVFSRGPGRFAWPTKPKTSSNTLVGVLGRGRPTDSKTVHKDPGLRRAGSGGDGLSSLSGYKPRDPATFPRGAAIPKNVTRDFFGKKINPQRPPRGAAG